MIVVIGGGISGLTTAFYLRKYGLDVVLLEGADRSGGKIQTLPHNDFLLERGPSSLRIDNSETHALISDLNLDSRVVLASEAAKSRYIVLNGKLQRVPTSVMSFLASPILSAKAKMRVLKEPFIPRSTRDDETVDDFARRRFGHEPAAKLIDPMVSGIYAGDARQLSTRSTFPQLWYADQEFHSVARGMLRRKAGKRIRKQIVNFQTGMQELTRSLMMALGPSYIHSSPVRNIHHDGSGFVVETDARDYRPWRVVLSTPADAASLLMSGLAPALSAELGAVHYPRVALVHLGFSVSQFEKLPTGFGFLVPSSEHRKILGCVYNSSTFAGRAPSGSLLLTVVMGGALSDPAEEWEEERLVGIALKELRSILSFTGEATLASATIWPRAIPQYGLRHRALEDQITETELRIPGLHFRSNYAGGIALGACIRNSVQLAARIAADFSDV